MVAKACRREEVGGTPGVYIQKLCTKCSEFHTEGCNFFAGEKSINSYYNMQGMQDECVLIINTYARLLCSFGLLANFPYNFVR